MNLLMSKGWYKITNKCWYVRELVEIIERKKDDRLPNPCDPMNHQSEKENPGRETILREN